MPTSSRFGFGVNSSHTNASHSIPYSGRNCLPSWLLLAHGVTAGQAYASTSTATTSPLSRPGQDSLKHSDLMQLLRTPFVVAAQHSFTICLSHLSVTPTWPALLKPLPEIIYPCSSLLPPRRSLNRNQSHVTSPRPEPLSPVATDQSLGPIYRNHLRHQCQAQPGFLPCFQVDLSPWHERNYDTVCSPPQPVLEPQDHTCVCGSSLLLAPLPRAQEPCFQGPDAATRGPFTSGLHDCQ